MVTIGDAEVCVIVAFWSVLLASEKVCLVQILWMAYTLTQKYVPTFKLSVTLSHLNRFSKFLHCRNAYEICYKTWTRKTKVKIDKVTESLKVGTFLRHCVVRLTDGESDALSV